MSRLIHGQVIYYYIYKMRLVPVECVKCLLYVHIYYIILNYIINALNNDFKILNNSII